jgi:calcium/calmodulin-dependent protein kinase I
MRAQGAMDSNSSAPSAPSIEKVLMEAHMIRNLKHPNIIQLEDVFSDRNTLFLVMELVRGGDLFDRIIKVSRYSEDSAKAVMVQVLDAMHFMHSKNIAHRVFSFSYSVFFIV